MEKPNEGIKRKYEVRRTDGSSIPGGKHSGCSYFVLDINHDEFSLAALKAYAEACKSKLPALAVDLMQIVNAKACNCREANCGHAYPFGARSAMSSKLTLDDMKNGRGIFGKA